MSNLALRALTAVVALPLVGALIVWREPLGFGVLVLIVAMLALIEYTGLTLASASRRLRGAVVLLAGHATVAPTMTIADCFLVAGPAAVLGPIGDLVESMIKRSVGAKD